MSPYLRLRQICLVGSDMPKVIADMTAIFGVKLAYQDPHVAKFGLENALFPFGLSFIEVVVPVRPQTAAGRFVERSGGVGGYMAIFNCDDPKRRGDHAVSLGVAIAHSFDHPGFVGVQLHPRDCRAAMIEFDRTDGEEDLTGPYFAAGGSGWTHAIKTDVTQSIVSIELETRRPADLAAHWSRILEKPVGGIDRSEIAVDLATMCFVQSDRDRECLSAITIKTTDPTRVLAAAEARGFASRDARFEFCGVQFHVT